MSWSQGESCRGEVRSSPTCVGYVYLYVNVLYVYNSKLRAIVGRGVGHGEVLCTRSLIGECYPPVEQNGFCVYQVKNKNNKNNVLYLISLIAATTFMYTYNSQSISKCFINLIFSRSCLHTNTRNAEH